MRVKYGITKELKEDVKFLLKYTRNSVVKERKTCCCITFCIKQYAYERLEW